MQNFQCAKGKNSIHTQLAARSVLEYLPAIATLVVPLLLGGCASGIISLEQGSPLVCETSSSADKICGLSDTALVWLNVKGQGQCGTIGMKWGDGTQQSMPGNFNRLPDGVLPVQHTYANQFLNEPRVWPGPKLAHVFSLANCTGEAKLRVNVLRENTDASGNPVFSPKYAFGLGFGQGGQPNLMACTTAPNMRPMRAGSAVHVSSLSGTRINFGCIGDACTYDMNGSTDPTPSNFPFPNQRKHSLVFRIVGANGQTQLEQGGTQTSFVVRQDGPLEFCANDTILSDNTGAWGIGIVVDETAVP